MSSDAARPGGELASAVMSARRRKTRTRDTKSESNGVGPDSQLNGFLASGCLRIAPPFRDLKEDTKTTKKMDGFVIFVASWRSLGINRV